MKVNQHEVMTKRSSLLQVLFETLPLMFLTGVFVKFSLFTWEKYRDGDVMITKTFFGIIAGTLSLMALVLGLLSFLTLLEIIKEK